MYMVCVPHGDRGACRFAFHTPPLTAAGVLTSRRFGSFLPCFPVAVEQELGAMILTTEKMRMFTRADYTEQGDLSAYSKNLVDLPPVRWEYVVLEPERLFCFWFGV